MYIKESIEIALADDGAHGEVRRAARTCLLRPKDAISIGECLLELDPVNPFVHSMLGWSYLNAGKLDEAIASFRKTSSVSPTFIYSQVGIGWALLLKDEPKGDLALVCGDLESYAHAEILPGVFSPEISDQPHRKA